jgi:long-chain acyl-CoA synthetase
MENFVDKIWLKSYPEGIPELITIDPNDSLVNLFDTACREYPNKPGYVNFDRVMTYKELDKLSRDFAAYLQKVCKLKRGDRVAIMMPNLLQYPIAMFGILRAGLIAVNVNPLYTPRELEHQLSDSGAKAIILWEGACATLEHIHKKTALEHVIITKVGDMLGLAKGAIFNFVLKYVKKQIKPYNLPNAVSFKEVIRKGSKEALTRHELKAKDTALLQYTGGTTGVAKGAILSHGNILANVYQAEAWLNGYYGPGEDDVVLTALPLYHIFSLTANLFVFTHLGALSVLITNPRDIPALAKTVKKYQLTTITGVNTLYNALANNAQFQQCDFSKLKLSLAGGTAAQRVVAERWHQVTGSILIEAYGLTETSPAVTANPLNIPAFTGAIGIPIPSTEIKICDDDGKEVPLNHPGELFVRGPQVMQGYWLRPEETREVLSEDGWLHTGDIATIDEEGFVRLVDRKKDMILVSGFNVYPNEIEDVVASLPGVEEVAAIGVPDEHSGEVVKLFIVKRDPELTEEQVRAYCQEQLAGYKRPKYIEFRDSLPKTNVGKILRRGLRSGTEEVTPQVTSKAVNS